MNKDLLIVGGTGFIGRHLAREAVYKGYRTTILSLHHEQEKNIVQEIVEQNI